MISNRIKFSPVIITVITIIFLSCTKQQQEEYHPPEMVKEIKPDTGNTEQFESLYERNGSDTGQSKPLIPVNENENLISTLNLNLDLDSQDEQILVFKERGKADGKIFIAVADYSNVENAYTRAWQSYTGADNARSFVVYLEDLVGDHNSEIVCSGRDSAGNTTLDVFWKNTTDNKLGYIPIFNIAARGTIEINKLERSRGYLQGLKNGISYTITVTNEEIDDQENISLTETEYFWDFPVRKYSMLSQKNIENNTVQQKQLENITEGDESLFYDFIDGPWFNGDNIIAFSPDDETVTFYADDIQENYNWVNSYKVLSNLLYIRCKNEIINYIENEIYIRILDTNEVSITVRDIDNQTFTKNANEIWTNQYYRMNSDMMNSSIKTLESVIDNSGLPDLSGQYVSDSGDILEFYGSDFYLKSSTEEIKGGFAVYSADTKILNLKIVDSKGIVTEERTFALDYTEEQKDSTIERTIVLTPGTLGIYGFHPYDTEYYRFTQIETRELSTDGNQ